VLHGENLARILAAALLAVLTVIAGCGGAGAPRGPSAGTRAAVARAEEHERARRHDLARAEYERAIAAAPDRDSEVFARIELASQLAFWGEIAEAVAQLEAVVALDPKLARAWHDLGILRHQLGEDAGAQEALERAVSLAPRDPRPRIALAALLWQRGDRAGARAQYEALLELDLPPRLREKVEWALQQLSRGS
jgi:Flp pilus assembly protein TadD